MPPDTLLWFAAKNASSRAEVARAALAVASLAVDVASSPLGRAADLPACPASSARRVRLVRGEGRGVSD